MARVLSFVRRSVVQWVEVEEEARLPEYFPGYRRRGEEFKKFPRPALSRTVSGQVFEEKNRRMMGR